MDNTKVDNKKTLWNRLDIPKERADFLGDKCREIFTRELQNEKHDKDSVDMMWEMRNNYSKSAGEDMYVCYIIGAMQGAYIATCKTNPLGILLSAFLK